ncbi:hypothetical protein PROFUN_02198 [Planoprotostelium fungivorum]|uniref:SET domain-containing protein n=1 Tax=Planoprotostelium fungivorum TaxID=1890364 RepID=A0A2P6NZE8_9EUKA|nr:hypothetical protein PROFUN_02198 [Planoprotostelium fungivorum]
MDELILCERPATSCTQSECSLLYRGVQKKGFSDRMSSGRTFGTTLITQSAVVVWFISAARTKLDGLLFDQLYSSSHCSTMPREFISMYIRLMATSINDPTQFPLVFSLHHIPLVEAERVIEYGGEVNRDFNFGGDLKNWESLCTSMKNIIHEESLHHLITPDNLKVFCWITRLNSFSLHPFSSADQYMKNAESTGHTLPMRLKDEISHRYAVDGVGIYVASSLFNHSCLPNARVVTRYTDDRHSLVALRDIQEGEEINISYMDISLFDEPQGIHTELYRRYLFQCDCRRD